MESIGKMSQAITRPLSPTWSMANWDQPPGPPPGPPPSCQAWQSVLALDLVDLEHGAGTQPQLLGLFDVLVVEMFFLTSGLNWGTFFWVMIVDFKTTRVISIKG